MPLFLIDHLMRIGQPENIAPAFEATGVSTDSRSIKPGDLFFALKGPRFDGHEFAAKVFSDGAVASVVDRTWWTGQSKTPDGSFVVVEDTLAALQQFAANHRSTFNGGVMAITGTNGKTTCKEMTSAVLSTTFRTVSTAGNLNNEIGVPLTLLRIEADTEMVIVEMGANKKGDIRVLCQMAAPTGGVITNIGTAHLESFGDVDTIAATKTELFDSLRSKGTRYINMDDERLRGQADEGSGTTTFGFDHEAGYRGHIDSVNQSACVRLTIKTPDDETAVVQLNVPGKHQAANALIAAVIGHSNGVKMGDVVKALETFTSTNSRMTVRKSGPVTLIDDTYNANPESVKAAIDTLMMMKTNGRRIAVLADMLELGETSGEKHREIGRYLLKMRPDAVFLTGSESRQTYAVARLREQVNYYDSQPALIDALKSFVKPEDVVLIKGSRSMQMENTVKAL